MTIFRAKDFIGYKESRIAKVLLRSAKDGMWPWVPDTVDLSTDYDIDFHEQRIIVEGRRKSWGGYLFYSIVHLPRDVILDYPDGDGWLDMAYEMLVRGFRNRPIDHEIPSNIYLGEN